MIGSNPYAQMETEAPVKTTGKKKVRLSLFGVAFLIVFIIFLALLAVQVLNLAYLYSAFAILLILYSNLVKGY